MALDPKQPLPSPFPVPIRQGPGVQQELSQAMQDATAEAFVDEMLRQRFLRQRDRFNPDYPWLPRPGLTPGPGEKDGESDPRKAADWQIALLDQALRDALEVAVKDRLPQQPQYDPRWGMSAAAQLLAAYLRRAFPWLTLAQIAMIVAQYAQNMTRGSGGSHPRSIGIPPGAVYPPPPGSGWTIVQGNYVPNNTNAGEWKVLGWHEYLASVTPGPGGDWAGVGPVPPDMTDYPEAPTTWEAATIVKLANSWNTATVWAWDGVSPAPGGTSEVSPYDPVKSPTRWTGVIPQVFPDFGPFDVGPEDEVHARPKRALKYPPAWPNISVSPGDWTKPDDETETPRFPFPDLVVKHPHPHFDPPPVVGDPDGPDVVVTGGGSYTNPPGHTFAPPKHRTKEIKVKPKYPLAFRVGMSALTESHDFIMSLHKALPKKCRKSRTWQDKDGKWHRALASSMLRDIYNCAGRMNVGLAVANLIGNQVQDYVIGKVNRTVNAQTGRLFGSRYRQQGVATRIGHAQGAAEAGGWAPDLTHTYEQVVLPKHGF